MAIIRTNITQQLETPNRKGKTNYTLLTGSPNWTGNERQLILTLEPRKARPGRTVWNDRSDKSTRQEEDPKTIDNTFGIRNEVISKLGTLQRCLQFGKGS